MVTKETATNKPLVVYKASAGSGKTFTLAKEYIKYLIADPKAYRSILAVTFTNKATQEMKQRILSHLYGIANHLPDSKEYLEQICKELDMDSMVVSANAKEAVSNIIHDYSYFRVETIDTFFQSVLRNLARELDLTTNLSIELNDHEIEENAVDELIESLDKNSIILTWILEYIKDNISEDKGWNVIWKIKKFGTLILKDFYKEHREQLNSELTQHHFFATYAKKIRDIREESKTIMSGFGNAFLDILDKNQLTPGDFNYGESGPCGYFLKLKKGVFATEELLKKRVEDAIEKKERWLKKEHRTEDDPQFQLVSTQIHPLILEAERARKVHLRLYNSAELTLRHLNQLRLLYCIDEKMHESNRENNRFLLGDTQALLSSLIENSDSPFIFEKIGTQIEHIMIDEFQDTSTIQWKNFKVLLSECMSHEHARNMIVGDVKQSIYRWRDGDWGILNDIDNDKDFGLRLDVKPLTTNYRSSRNVITFNNAFFETARTIEYEHLTTGCEPGSLAFKRAQSMQQAYADVCQEIPADRPAIGYVQIRLSPKERYKEEALAMIADTIMSLQDAGSSLNDIAILVRSNNDIQNIADFFLQNYPDTRIVSDEAFRLDYSEAVNIIIGALYLLLHPDDRLALVSLAKLYQQQMVDKEQIDNLLLAHLHDMDTLLPREFTYAHSEHLLSMSLIELVETIYRIFQLKEMKNQGAYISAFYDILNEYLRNNTADIEEFLNEWNERLHKKTIQSNEIEGIRLLTIHKSKGLEFANVIIPYCDWQLEKSNNVVWCSPKEAPFSDLSLVPIDYNAKMMKASIYESDYQEEHLQNVVDNLNLLYVAFTRAGNNLFIQGQRGNQSLRSALIEECMKKVTDELSEHGAAMDAVQNEKGEELIFEFGTVATPKEKKKETNNRFLQLPTRLTIPIENFKSKVVFRQSNKSEEFIHGADSNKKTYIQLGMLLHSVFSTIRTREDIEPTLTKLKMDGILDNETVTEPQLAQMLHKALDNPLVCNWFSTKWTLFNECDILYHDPDDGEMRKARPDRVMTDGQQVIVVDFKFAAPQPEHIKQVQHYMSLLHTMGYQNIKGYLWYVFANNIEEVIYE